MPLVRVLSLRCKRGTAKDTLYIPARRSCFARCGGAPAPSLFIKSGRGISFYLCREGGRRKASTVAPIAKMTLSQNGDEERPQSRRPSRRRSEEGSGHSPPRMGRPPPSPQNVGSVTPTRLVLVNNALRSKRLGWVEDPPPPPGTPPPFKDSGFH